MIRINLRLHAAAMLLILSSLIQTAAAQTGTETDSRSQKLAKDLYPKAK